MKSLTRKMTMKMMMRRKESKMMRRLSTIITSTVIDAKMAVKC